MARFDLPTSVMYLPGASRQRICPSMPLIALPPESNKGIEESELCTLGASETYLMSSPAQAEGQVTACKGARGTNKNIIFQIHAYDGSVLRTS